MTEDEKNELIEKINTFWTSRPKSGVNEEKKKLVPVHDFDNMTFTDQEHVDAVRKYYEEHQ